MSTDRSTTPVPRRVRTRAASLAAAGVLVGLTLAPVGALADHPTTPGDGRAPTSSGSLRGGSYDVPQRADRHRVPPAKARHDYLVQRKAHPALARILVAVTPSGPATCYLPGTIATETRRLIAAQLCVNAHIVPAVFDRGTYSFGHL